MTLLDNAAGSIRIGVQDYQSEDSARVLSGVRNITAGVLLLFKEKLRRMSPDGSDEVLLKQRVTPIQKEGGEVVFRGSGRKTVDVQEITTRFESLNIHVDWRPVRGIVDLRNEIEHYYTGKPATRMRELIADTFVVVRDFTAVHLGIEPQELLGKETWQHLLTVGELYQAELVACEAARDTLDWPADLRSKLNPHIRCPACDSELLKPTPSPLLSIFATSFKCSSCGQEVRYCDLAEAAIDGCYGAEAFIAIKDGGDPPFDSCPECDRDTYLYDLDVCAACGYTRTYRKCAICHTGLMPDDQIHGGLCSYHSSIASRDD